MADLPDMERRDPNNINDHIQVAFEDVLAEPEGIRSMDCVWKNSYNCFECWKKLCYTIMTVFCGICIAMEWGCVFAQVSFRHIWCYTPCMRVCIIECGMWKKCLTVVTECCIVPCCQALGTLFSLIKITKG